MDIKSEVKFNNNTRFDFLITKKDFKAFVEVKNVTLSRKKGLSEFPDAITSRGLKHIKELMHAQKKVIMYILLLLFKEKIVKNCQ